MMQEEKVYLRCRNCGKHIALDQVEKEQFCSLECARQYRQCIVCGRYFLPSTDTPYCSEECAETGIETKE